MPTTSFITDTVALKVLQPSSFTTADAPAAAPPASAQRDSEPALLRVDRRRLFFTAGSWCSDAEEDRLACGCCLPSSGDRSSRASAAPPASGPPSSLSSESPRKPRAKSIRTASPGGGAAARSASSSPAVSVV